MSDELARILDRARQWCERARAAGWLEPADVDRLDAVERGTPADLFVERAARPLVVALFGGTGVGKSSLLNRLAGAAIARTGPERPTSREVTVYVHEAVKLAELPAELPLDAVRIQRHTADAQRAVLWLDAPDIDSTVETNRQCALAWLPHVDLVCYVVSPERYRDDAGWRFLLDRGQRHGWLFVLNRWDEGDAGQAEDFTAMLRQAGFDDPLLLRTCCVPGRPLPSADEFGRLDAAIRELLRAHGVQELERLGVRARLRALRSALEPAARRLGDEETWAGLADACRQQWERSAAAIREGVEWPLRIVAERLAARDGGLLVRLGRGVAAVRSGRRPEPPAADEPDAAAAVTDLVGRLWDDWTQARLLAWVDGVELALRRAGVASDPVRQGLEAETGRAGARVRGTLDDALRAALARPGTAVQRLLRKLTGFLSGFLPLLALVWVAIKVVRGYTAAEREGEFLGVAFAIHSALLILLAWLVPFTVDRLLRPPLDRIALRGLRRGLDAGLADLGDRLLAVIEEQAAVARRFREQFRTLQRDLDGLLGSALQPRTPLLRRLLARPGPEPPSPRNDAQVVESK